MHAVKPAHADRGWYGPKVLIRRTGAVLSAGTSGRDRFRSLDTVRVMERLAALAARGADVLLGLAFAGLLAATAYRRAGEDSRGWLLDCGVGAVVCVAALLRERGRLVAAAVGLTVTAAAVLAADMGYLTDQPGVAVSLALTVLAGSAVRALPPWRAAAVAAAGFAVTTAGRIMATSRAAGEFHMGVQGWTAGLGAGLVLRFVEYRRQAVVEAVRRGERLALARELHDVVAHHVSGIVMHTHAAQIMLRKQPDRLAAALADIEHSGTDAMDAMRSVIALLRDTEDGHRGTGAADRPGPPFRRARPGRRSPAAHRGADLAAGGHHHGVPGGPGIPDQHRPPCPWRSRGQRHHPPGPHGHHRVRADSRPDLDHRSQR